MRRRSIVRLSMTAGLAALLAGFTYRGVHAQTAASDPGDAFCSLVSKINTWVDKWNKVGGAIGTFTLPMPTCNAYKDNMLHYQGSEANNSLAAVVAMPVVAEHALYCATADAHGPVADGTTDTIVGRFGVQSRLNVSQRTATTDGKLVGQRVGKLMMFGVGMDVDVQRFEMGLVNEPRPATNLSCTQQNGSQVPRAAPEQMGNYFWVRSGYAHTKLSGNGDIPTPVPGLFVHLGFGIDFGHPNAYAQLNNNAFSREVLRNGMSLPLPSMPNEFDYNWNALRCSTFQCPSGSFCQMPPECIAAAMPRCGCPASGCNNTGYKVPPADGFIPYDGDNGGASGNLVFVQPNRNWFHFGFPATGPSGAVGGEPTYSLTSSTDPIATTRVSFDLQGKYKLGPASLTVGPNVTMAMKSGFGLRQELTGFTDVGGRSGRVWTELDAQTRTDLKVVVLLDLPIIPTIDLTFNLITGDLVSDTKVPTEIGYSVTPGAASHFLSYKVGGTLKTNPEQARFACLPPPTIPSPAAVTPADPGSWIDQVKDAGIKYVHPCAAILCDGNGRQYSNCSWSKTTKNFSCVTISAPNTCDPCRFPQQVQICREPDNKVLKNVSTVTTSTCVIH